MSDLGKNFDFFKLRTLKEFWKKIFNFKRISKLFWGNFQRNLREFRRLSRDLWKKIEKTLGEVSDNFESTLEYVCKMLEKTLKELWKNHKTILIKSVTDWLSQRVSESVSDWPSLREASASKNMLGQKNFGSKKSFWAKKLFGSENFLGQIIFWVKKIFGSKNLIKNLFE